MGRFTFVKIWLWLAQVGEEKYMGCELGRG